MTLIARIYIVRHGETDSNRNRIIQGHLDTELNAHGRAQAERVTETLKNIHFDCAYSSDLRRAVKTAEQILAHHPGVALEKCEGLRERFMGELQGEVAPSNKPAPSLEKNGVFMKRTVTWWTDTVLEYVTSVALDAERDGRCRNVLALTHGGFIATLLRTLLISRSLTYVKGIVIGHCANTSITLVEIRGTSAGGLAGHLVKFADASHLEGMEQVGINVDVVAN